MSMVAANKERGEVSLKHKGELYILRPQFDAVMRIEAALNKTIIQLARDVRVMELGQTQMAIIFSASCVNHELSVSEAGNIIFDLGFDTAFSEISAFIANALTGGRPPKKPKAATKKKVAKKAAKKKTKKN